MKNKWLVILIIVIIFVLIADIFMISSNNSTKNDKNNSDNSQNTNNYNNNNNNDSTNNNQNINNTNNNINDNNYNDDSNDDSLTTNSEIIYVCNIKKNIFNGIYNNKETTYEYQYQYYFIWNNENGFKEGNRIVHMKFYDKDTYNNYTFDNTTSTIKPYFVSENEEELEKNYYFNTYYDPKEYTLSEYLELIESMDYKCSIED